MKKLAILVFSSMMVMVCFAHPHNHSNALNENSCVSTNGQTVNQTQDSKFEIENLHQQECNKYENTLLAGMRVTRWVTCDHCGGDGEICITKKCYGCPGGSETKCVTCSKCNGKGRIQETVEL